MYAKLYRQKSLDLMDFIGLTPRFLNFFNFPSSNIQKRLKAPVPIRQENSNSFENPEKRKAESLIKPLAISVITIDTKSGYEIARAYPIQ
jgi:hypothetical protein